MPIPPLPALAYAGEKECVTPLRPEDVGEDFENGLGARQMDDAEGINLDWPKICPFRAKEILANGRTEILQFAFGNRLGRMPLAKIRAVLHFNKNKHPILLGDQVDFTLWGTKVTGDNLVALLDKVMSS